MSIYTYRDLTSNEIEIIKSLVANNTTNPLATRKWLEDRIALSASSNTAQFRVNSVTVMSGVLTVQRLERVTVVIANTEGDAPADSIDTITASSNSSFHDYDRLIIFPYNAARKITFTSAGNIVVNGGTASTTIAASYREFVHRSGTWVENPSNDHATVVVQSLYATEEVITAGAAIRSLSSLIKTISERTGETLAQWDLTITATTGTVGGITAYADIGEGAAALGSANYSGATTPTALATLLAAAINLLTGVHGFTATSSVGVVTITAPAGTGADANAYTMTYAVTGGCTSTGYAVLTVGADGADQNDTLTTINDTADGKCVTVYNDMEAHTITVTSAGNIDVASSRVLNPGKFIPLIFINTKWRERYA